MLRSFTVFLRRPTLFRVRLGRCLSNLSVSSPVILKELRNYCRKGKPENVLQSLQKLVKSGIVLDDSTVFTAIKSLVDDNQIEMAESVFNFCAENQIRISNKIIHVLAHGNSRVGNHNRVVELMGLKMSSPHPLDSVALFNGYCKAGEVSKAKTLFDEIITNPNVNLSMVRIYTSLMTCYLAANDFDAAIETFKSFDSRYNSPDLHMFHTLIGAYASKGDCQSARSVFHRIVSVSKLVPTIVTWNKLLSAYSNAGEWRSVQHIASLIRSSKNVAHTAKPPSKENSVENLNFYNILKKYPLEPDSITYNICMQSLACHTDRRDELLANLNWCMSKQLVIGKSTQFSIAAMFARVGMMQETMGIISRFSNANPDISAYALVCALCQDSALEKSKAIKSVLEMCDPKAAIEAMDRCKDQQSKELLMSHFSD